MQFNKLSSDVSDSNRAPEHGLKLATCREIWNFWCKPFKSSTSASENGEGWVLTQNGAGWKGP